MALAVAVGLGGAEIILLDEPTSALDEETMKKVEKTLTGLLPGGENVSIRGFGGGVSAVSCFRFGVPCSASGRKSKENEKMEIQVDTDC